MKVLASSSLATGATALTTGPAAGQMPTSDTATLNCVAEPHTLGSGIEKGTGKAAEP